MVIFAVGAQGGLWVAIARTPHHPPGSRGNADVGATVRPVGA